MLVVPIIPPGFYIMFLKTKNKSALQMCFKEGNAFITLDRPQGYTQHPSNATGHLEARVDGYDEKHEPN